MRGSTEDGEMTKPETERLYTDDDLHVILQDWDESDPDQCVAINLALECLRHRARLGVECHQCEGTGIRQNDEGRNEFCQCRTTPAPASEVEVTDEMVFLAVEALTEHGFGSIRVSQLAMRSALEAAIAHARRAGGEDA
jgi:hypothetical protein